MHALDHVRRRLLQVADDAPVRAVVVDASADEVAGEEIPHDPQRQLGLLVDERRCRCVLGLRLDGLPEPLEEHEIALDVLGGRALGGGAHDDPAALRVEPLHDLLQARALGVLEPPRDARALAVRHVDEEAAGQRDLGREARALRLHRILDGLHHDRLAALDQILDLAGALAPLELRADDLVDVEEAVLLEADLDERRLHPRQHVVDDAEVDVPCDRATLRALEVDLGDAIVLEDRDALLADVDRDDELALRRGQRRALRRRAPAVAAPRLLSVRLERRACPTAWNASSGPSPQPPRRSRARRRTSPSSRDRRDRLLPSLAAATPATSPLLRPRRRALLVPGLCCHLLYGRASGGASTSGRSSPVNRVLFLLLAKAKPA